VASPMSFAGSWDRMVRTPGAVGLVLLPVWWPAVAIWYLAFGLLVVPWRLVRRGARRRKVAERRHRELLEDAGRRDPNRPRAVWDP
jgi:hypothetical protein